MSLLQFDPMGTLQANRFTNEPHTISAVNGVDHNFFVPHWAPFFAKDLVVVDANTGMVLEENEDYYLGYHFAEATEKTGFPIYGAVVMADVNRTGTFYLTGQSLGGSYVDDERLAIENGLATIDDLLNPDWTEIVDRIINLPETFPPTPHTTKLDEVEGVSALLAKLEAMTIAITDTPRKISLNDIADLETQYTQPLLAAMRDIATEIAGIAEVDNYYYVNVNTVQGSDVIPGPITNHWYNIPGASITVANTGAFNLILSSNAAAEITDGTGGFLPTDVRFQVNGQTVSESYLRNVVIGLNEGDVVTMQTASPYLNTERIHCNGQIYGCGIAALRMGR